MKVYNQVNSNLDRIPPGTASPLISAPQPLRCANSDPDVEFGGGHSRRAARSRPAYSGTAPQCARCRQDLSPGCCRARGPGMAGSDAARRLRLEPRGRRDVNPRSQRQVAAGSVVSQEGREHPIRVAAALTDAGEVGNVVVDARNDRPVFLRDVATVTAGPAADDVRSSSPSVRPRPKRRSAPGAESAVTIAIAPRRAPTASRWRTRC